MSDCFSHSQQDVQCRSILNVPIHETPEDKLHCVIIGGGPAGIEAARVFARYDHKVALVEGNCCCGGQEVKYGGYAMAKLAELAHTRQMISESREMGIDVDEINLDWAAAMIAVKETRAEAARLYDLRPLVQQGLSVYCGKARFISHKQIDIDGGPALKFERCVIATGARPCVPQIPGLEGFAVSPSQIFTWDSLPERIAIVGGGLTGVELANSLRNFGARVFLIEKTDRLCAEMTLEAREAIVEILTRNGVEVFLQNEITSVTDVYGAKRLRLTGGYVMLADSVILCAGTQPNTDLNLSAGDVDFDVEGIFTHGKHFKTSNKRIFAVGDCRKGRSGLYTNAIDEARAVAEYIRTNDPCVVPLLYPPRTAWLYPQIVEIGRCGEQLDREGVAYDVLIADFRDSAKAQIEATPAGFAKFWLRRNTEKVLGAVFVHAQAQELVSEVSILINHELPFGNLASVAHSDSSLMAPIATIAARHTVRLRSQTAKHQRTLDTFHKTQRERVEEPM